MNLSMGNYKIKLEVLILIGVLLWIIWGHLVFGCSKISFGEGFSLLSRFSKEGFSGIKNMSYVPDVSYTNTPPVNTKYWDNPANMAIPDNTKYKEFQDPKYLLGKGQLDIFAATEFAPKFCSLNPSYSNSSGCANINQDQYKYLRERGGNNVPYSDY
jgi:hypothetical protein